jgi:hypothetical protein
MGAENKCQAKVRGQSDTGQALLETNEVIFRGKQRCVVKLDTVRATAEVKGEWLLLGELELKLKAQAPKWLEKIKHPKSVLDKLGVKPGELAWLVGGFEAAFTKDLMAHGLSVFEGVPQKQKAAQLVFFRLTAQKDLQTVEKLAKTLTPDGTLWLIRPKGKDAAVTEAQTMAAGKAAGLVDVKVVAFSESLSAEKYVVPLARRNSSSR